VGPNSTVRDPSRGEIPHVVLAFIHFPIALRVIPQLQQAILGVVPLPAAWADQVSTPTRALAVVFLGNGKAGATTAWDQIHPYEWLGRPFLRR
jgi:hypothetical protein